MSVKKNIPNEEVLNYILITVKYPLFSVKILCLNKVCLIKFKFLNILSFRFLSKLKKSRFLKKKILKELYSVFLSKNILCFSVIFFESVFDSFLNGTKKIAYLMLFFCQKDV